MKKAAVIFVVILVMTPCILAVIQGIIYFGHRVQTTGFAIPSFYIQTKDGKIPADKEHYVACTVTLSGTPSPRDAFTAAAGIRLRGNSTIRYDKKPYRIKFDQKQSLFGSVKNKSWALLADYLDPSDMRNFTALNLARGFDGLDFTPDAHHVMVYLNGEFMGLYLLCDQINENTGRLNLANEPIDPTTGDIPYYVEMDDRAGREGQPGIDYFRVEGFPPVAIKYPDAADYDPETWTQIFTAIQSHVTAVLTLLQNGDVGVEYRGAVVRLTDLLDEASLMDFLLVNEIVGNFDARTKSIHLYHHRGGKLQFGPVWDFDACMIRKWREYDTDLSIVNQIYFLDGPLGEAWLSIPGNAEKLYTRYLEKRGVILDTVDVLSEYHDYIAPAARADRELWYGVGAAVRFEQQYQFIEDYLLLRYEHLKKLLKS